MGVNVEPSSNQPVTLSLASNPVVQTVFSVLVVSAGVRAASTPSLIGDPLLGPVASLYVHTSPGLMVANIAVLTITGAAITRRTSGLRFHFFFAGVGVVSATLYAQTLGGVGPSLGGVGASAAAIAFSAYSFTGIVRPRRVLDFPRALPVLGGVVGLSLAGIFFHFGPGGVHVAHIAGGVIGLVAGHFNLLRVR